MVGLRATIIENDSKTGSTSPHAQQVENRCLIVINLKYECKKKYIYLFIKIITSFNSYSSISTKTHMLQLKLC